MFHKVEATKLRLLSTFLPTLITESDFFKCNPFWGNYRFTFSVAVFTRKAGKLGTQANEVQHLHRLPAGHLLLDLRKCWQSSRKIVFGEGDAREHRGQVVQFPTAWLLFAGVPLQEQNRRRRESSKVLRPSEGVPTVPVALQRFGNGRGFELGAGRRIRFRLAHWRRVLVREMCATLCVHLVKANGKRELPKGSSKHVLGVTFLFFFRLLLCAGQYICIEYNEWLVFSRGTKRRWGNIWACCRLSQSWFGLRLLWSPHSSSLALWTASPQNCLFSRISFFSWKSQISSSICTSDAMRLGTGRNASYYQVYKYQTRIFF